MSSQSESVGPDPHTSHWRPNSLLKLIAAGGACALAAVGAQTTAERRIPIEFLRSVPSAQGVSPGLEWPAQIELIPDALIVSPEGRESVEYHAEIIIERGTRVGVAWDAEIVNDLGNVLHSGLAKGQERGAKGSMYVTEPIRVDLADGFYALRARAAIVPDDEPSNVMERIQYFEVAEGKWTELLESEWYRLSRAGTDLSAEDEVSAANGAPEVMP